MDAAEYFPGTAHLIPPLLTPLHAPRLPRPAVPPAGDGVGADVAVEHLIRHRPTGVAETGQPRVGVGHVDRAPGGCAVVAERIGEPVLVGQADLIDFDLGDSHETACS